jgi:hypothetical protein
MQGKELEEILQLFFCFSGSLAIIPQSEPTYAFRQSDRYPLQVCLYFSDFGEFPTVHVSFIGKKAP